MVLLKNGENYRPVSESNGLGQIIVWTAACSPDAEGLESIIYARFVQMITPDDFNAWMAGNVQVFETCRADLLATNGRLADALLVRVVERDDGSRETFMLGNPDYARAAAIEDLDCKVSGGRLMLGERAVSAQVRIGSATSEFKRVERYGKETGRRLDPEDFGKAEYQGSEQLHALYRALLRRHAVREMKDCLPWFTQGDHVTGEDAESGWNSVPAEGSPVEADEVKQAVIEELARFSELLRADGQDAAAATTDAVITRLDRLPDLAGFENDHYGFWAGVGADLGVNRATLARRKHRFYEQLIRQRERLPKWLAGRALALLAGEAELAVEDCVRAGPLVPVEFSAVLIALRDFFLRTIASQNPKYRETSLKGVGEVAASALARDGGRVCLTSWPPCGDDFAEFCEREALLRDKPHVDISRLLTVLGDSRPRPIRLIGVLNSVFPDGTVQGGD